ncbi:hypothetical protein FV768_23790 [Vibrio parahaemolyticus]|nr:hypothetical protein [Vibrio parahaemolyticus]EHZ2727247.1 hypothetical protein [Vibrio parahaemolyticus]EIV1599971.1 hypothetical protein [Vibrio parahaemolyticus]
MTQNIEQRTEVAVKQYESASSTAHALSSTLSTLNVQGKEVKSLPKISDEWEEERKGLSIKSKSVLPWVEGAQEADINQQRRFTDGHTYLPKYVPLLMGNAPNDDWIPFTADKSDVLSNVFGLKPLDLSVGLIITPENKQYPKILAFGEVYELQDGLDTYTIKSFAQSNGGDCVITLDNDGIVVARKVDSASKKWTHDNFTTTVNTVSEMLNGEYIVGQLVKTKGYYTPGDGGGATYYIRDGNHGDGFSDHNVGNYTAVLQSNVMATAKAEVTILQSGAVANDAVDNALNIKSAVKKGIATVPLAKFYSSPIRFGVEYSECSLIGMGRGSVLSLISSDTTGGVPLIHIPQNGGFYGGTEEGAKNFFLDKLSLFGGDAVAKTTTTGLVVENSEGFGFGTIWSHGFFKSGMLITGTCKSFTGEKYFGYNNGNQTLAKSGGQGFAVSVENTNEQTIYIGYAECWDNGLSNFGQGFDAVSGNMSFGTINCYHNGSSGMKVVRARKITIGALTLTENNRHPESPFPAFYTNDDFGTVNIGVFDSTESAGSALGFVKSGVINIEKFKSFSPNGSGINCTPEAGKKAILNIKMASIDSAEVTGLTAGGDCHIDINKLHIRNSSNQGAVVNGGRVHIDKFDSLNNLGTPLFLNGGYTYVGDFYSESEVGNAAIVVSEYCENNVIISARSKGHSQTMIDNGLNTYKPNVI